MATTKKKATKASKATSAKKPASSKKSSKKAASKKVTAKKKAVKAATKKATEKKVAAKKASRKVLSASKKSTRKAPAKKAASKKVAAGVSAKSNAGRSKSTKATGRGVSKRQAAAVSTPEVIAPLEGAMRTASEVSGRKTTVYKVLAQREAGLQSIFARGLLRGTFSTEHFTLAPDGLPFTAFTNRRDAQRFVDMNERRRTKAWSPWVIVQGEGVMAQHTHRRVPKIHNFNPTNTEELKLATQGINRVGNMGYKRKKRYSSYTPNNPNKRWTLGTVFVSSFKITQPST